jgi:hypothetical protein
VSARKMRDLKVSDDDLESPGVVHEAVRPTTAAELLVTDEVPALDRPRRERGTASWRDDPAVGE